MLTVFVYTTPYEVPSHTTMMGDCGEGFDDRVCLTHGIYNFYVAVDSKGLPGTAGITEEVRLMLLSGRCLVICGDAA